MAASPFESPQHLRTPRVAHGIRAYRDGTPVSAGAESARAHSQRRDRGSFRGARGPTEHRERQSVPDSRLPECGTDDSRQPCAHGRSRRCGRGPVGAAGHRQGSRRQDRNARRDGAFAAARAGCSANAPRARRDHEDPRPRAETRANAASRARNSLDRRPRACGRERAESGSFPASARERSALFAPGSSSSRGVAAASSSPRPRALQSRSSRTSNAAKASSRSSSQAAFGAGARPSAISIFS